MQAKIKAAIADSIHSDRIVRVELPCRDISEAIVEIWAAWHGDMDYERENDGSYDVWGWEDDTEEAIAKDVWRLTVVLAD